LCKNEAKQGVALSGRNRHAMSYGFVANFIRFPAIQTFKKSVKIWQHYREFKGGTFFETHCRKATTCVYTEHCDWCYCSFRSTFLPLHPSGFSQFYFHFIRTSILTNLLF